MSAGWMSTLGREEGAAVLSCSRSSGTGEEEGSRGTEEREDSWVERLDTDSGESAILSWS